MLTGSAAVEAPGGGKTVPRIEIPLNAELWQGLDAALSGPRVLIILLREAKGHVRHL